MSVEGGGGGGWVSSSLGSSGFPLHSPVQLTMCFMVVAGLLSTQRGGHHPNAERISGALDEGPPIIDAVCYDDGAKPWANGKPNAAPSDAARDASLPLLQRQVAALCGKVCLVNLHGRISCDQMDRLARRCSKEPAQYGQLLDMTAALRAALADCALLPEVGLGVALGLPAAAKPPRAWFYLHPTADRGVWLLEGAHPCAPAASGAHSVLSISTLIQEEALAAGLPVSDPFAASRGSAAGGAVVSAAFAAVRAKTATSKQEELVERVSEGSAAGGAVVSAAFAAVRAKTATSEQEELVERVSAGSAAGGAVVSAAFAAVRANTATSKQEELVERVRAGGAAGGAVSSDAFAARDGRVATADQLKFVEDQEGHLATGRATTAAAHAAVRNRTATHKQQQTAKRQLAGARKVHTKWKSETGMCRRCETTVTGACAPGCTMHCPNCGVQGIHWEWLDGKPYRPSAKQWGKMKPAEVQAWKDRGVLLG